MTREEAIKIIDCYDIGFYDLSGEKIPADKLADAFDMAISALMHEIRTETHGVCLISKDDAIERIANDNVVGGMDRINEYRNSNEHNDYLDGISTAIATIDDLPSAEGEWEHWGSPFGEDDIINTMVCTNCGMRFVEIKGETFYYCPNCGARMKGGDTE